MRSSRLLERLDELAHFAGALSFETHAMPNLQIDENPQPEIVVGLSADMLLDETVDFRLPEKPQFDHARLLEQVALEIRQIAAQPAGTNAL